MIPAYRDHVKNIRNISFTVFEGAARVIDSLLILAVLVTLVWAVFKVLSDLTNIFTQNIPEALKVVMIDSLAILALLEVFKTALTYFSEGRVKVTYIIDTVLVVILTEVMAFWFKEIEYSKILMVIALVLSLIVARILAIRSAAHPGEAWSWGKRQASTADSTRLWTPWASTGHLLLSSVTVL